jgi:anti-anti-sigma regulatory factor
MEFKIDTNDTYTLILPTAMALDASMAASLRAKCLDLADEGSQNFVIDLTNAREADDASLEVFVSFHEECYEEERSLVFTGVVDGLLQRMKQARVHLTLNITPTLDEAIDMVNMEILERDLLNDQ